MYGLANKFIMFFQRCDAQLPIKPHEKITCDEFSRFASLPSSHCRRFIASRINH